MAEKRDIVADSFRMLELALMIGRNTNLDAAGQSRALIKALLARYRISYAAVWIMPGASSGLPHDATPELLCAMPALLGRTDGLTDTERTFFEAGAEPTLVQQIDGTDSRFDQGAMLLIRLKGLGLIKLYYRGADGVDEIFVNQILAIMEMFAVSLAGSYHLHRIELSEQEARQERLEAERLRLVAEDALDEANRASQTKNNFLLSMSHELRTPLNAIIGFSQMIDQFGVETLGPDKVGEYAADILQSGTYLLSLVDDILDISKIEHEDFELQVADEDLATIASECLRTLRARAASRNITLGFVAEAGSLVRIDGRYFRQCLLNLLSNAVKYSPEGSAVRIEIIDNAEGIGLHVIDQGGGIPKAVVDRLGQPFNRAANPMMAGPEGTGLGLAITRQLMEKMGGRLDISVHAGQGTRASLHLPSHLIAQPDLPAAACE